MTATVLDSEQWRARESAHQHRVDTWVTDHLARRQRGMKHPVEDFLYTYYSYRPAQLRTWHPGTGVVLAGRAAGRDYVAVEDGCMVDPETARRRRPTVTWIKELLQATAQRPAQFGCFAMHEWAMVYRQTQQEVRHNAWPLRLPPEGVAEVLHERGVRCTHFDAFRFFTPPARPLNAFQLTRDSQQAMEQPGCLHANMDLYKWSYKLSPLVPSELVADCFELARDVRTLDMQASPYDVSELGYPPVPVETAEGRAEYVRQQREFSERAAVLRDRLIDACSAALDLADQLAGNSAERRRARR